MQALALATLGGMCRAPRPLPAHPTPPSLPQGQCWLVGAPEAPCWLPEGPSWGAPAL